MSCRRILCERRGPWERWPGLPIFGGCFSAVWSKQRSRIWPTCTGRSIFCSNFWTASRMRTTGWTSLPTREVVDGWHRLEASVSWKVSRSIGYGGSGRMCAALRNICRPPLQLPACGIACGSTPGRDSFSKEGACGTVMPRESCGQQSALVR